MTFILKKSSNIPDALTCNKPTIALRYPDYTPLNFLLNLVKQPLLSTSVNIHGQVPAKKETDIPKKILSAVDFSYTNTLLLNNQASTIVDLSQDSEKVLRQGDIQFESL